jgi:hypothetical protein
MHHASRILTLSSTTTLFSLQKGAKVAEAVLRRYPKSQLVRTLKAYVSAHLGKKNVAGRLMDELVEEGPEDDRVLHTMMFVYKAIGRGDAILEAYTSAVNKRPSEPGIRVGLFGAYVRRLEYISQQQESFKLAKLEPAHADMYVWWSICSLCMQYLEKVGKRGVSNGGDSCRADASRLLQLAFSMAERQSGKGGVLSFEKFVVMGEILCGLGRHRDALEMGLKFDDVCRDSIPNSEKSRLLGSLYVRAGDLAGAASVFLDSAMEDPQDWVAWHMYVASMLPDLVESPCELPLGGRIDGGIVEEWDREELGDTWQEAAVSIGEGTGERIARVQRSLETMQDKFEGVAKMQRALILAELELARYAYAHDGNMVDLYSKIMDAVPGLAVYSSFAVDLRKYIALLDSPMKRSLAVEGMKACTRVSDSIHGQSCAENAAALRRAFVCVINGYMLQVETGAFISPAHKMIEIYFENEHLVREYDPKDRGLGEDLLVAAVGSLLVDHIKSPKDTGTDVSHLLVISLILIESAQKKRTASAPLRLAASALYGLLGAESLAAAQFSALDIKGVLHDSLTGHWMIPIISAYCPDEEQYATWFKGIINLHTVQAGEARDALFTVYEEQTYSKVPEFVDFIHSLDKSSTMHLYQSKNGILKYRTECLGSDADRSFSNDELRNPVPQSDMDDIVHNDDLTVRPIWYPPSLDGALCEIHSWWENLYNTDFSWSDGGLSSAWWACQIPPTAEPYGLRKEWESTVNRQIALRLEFPALFERLCGMRNSEGLEMVTTWLQTAGRGLGVKLSADSLVNHPSQVARTLLEKMRSETNAVKLPDYLTTLTVTFGYHFQLAGEEHPGSLLDTLQELSRGIDLVNESCSAAILHKRFAGSAFAARIAHEEYVWLAHVLSSYMSLDELNIKDRLQEVAHAVSSSSANLGALLTSRSESRLVNFDDIVENIAERELSECVRNIIDYDVSTLLTNLADAQDATRSRVKEALDAIVTKLSPT